MSDELPQALIQFPSEELTLEFVGQQLAELKFQLRSQDESQKLAQMKIQSRSEEEIQRIEAQMKRFFEQSKTKVGDVKDELEKKLFNSVNTILQQGADGQRSLETSLLRCEDQIETLQKMCTNIMTTNTTLKELTDLGQSNSSITEGLCAKISKTLQKELLDKLRTQFAGYYDFKQGQMDVEQRFNHLRAGTQEIARQMKSTEEKIIEKLDLYLQTTQFEDAMKNLSSKTEMTDVKNYLKELSQKSDCQHDLKMTNKSIQRIDTIMEIKLATKFEVETLDSELKKFFFCKFVTQEDYTSVAERIESKLNSIEKSNSYVMIEFEKVREIVKDLTEQMAHKVDDREIVKIHEQLGRFALYEDYKGLYAVVVPPVAAAQRSLETYSTQLAQFTEMIKRFDENLQIRALKTEVNYMISILKEYIKKSQFETFKEGLNGQLQAINQNKDAIQEQLRQTVIQFSETIRKTNKDMEKKLDKRMNERLENIPGYEPPSVSQKLGFGRVRDDLIEGHNPKDIKTVLKNKAEAEEVRKLFELKTNKVDSEIQMYYLDTMHRMLKNLAVLMAEQIRQGLNEKFESEASKSQHQKLLYDQSVMLQRWVTQFDPSQTGFEYQTMNQFKDLPIVTFAAHNEQGVSFLNKHRVSLSLKKPDTAQQGERHILLSGKRQTSTGGQTHRLIKALDLKQVNGQTNNLTIQYNSFTDRIQQHHLTHNNSKISSDKSEGSFSPNSPIRRSQYRDEFALQELKVASRCKEHDQSKTHTGNFALMQNKINLIDQLEPAQLQGSVEVLKRPSGTAAPSIRLKPLKSAVYK